MEPAMSHKKYPPEHNPDYRSRNGSYRTVAPVTVRPGHWHGTRFAPQPAGAQMGEDCPHTLVLVQTDALAGGGRRYAATCSGCPARGPWADSPDAAVAEFTRQHLTRVVQCTSPTHASDTDQSQDRLPALVDLECLPIRGPIPLYERRSATSRGEGSKRHA